MCQNCPSREGQDYWLNQCKVRLCVTCLTVIMHNNPALVMQRCVSEQAGENGSDNQAESTGGERVTQAG